MPRVVDPDGNIRATIVETETVNGSHYRLVRVTPLNLTSSRYVLENVSMTRFGAVEVCSAAVGTPLGDVIDKLARAADELKALADRNAQKNPPCYLPRYKHDCDLTCIFLGQHNEFDLYFHVEPTNGWKTVVARWSDEPSDYLSGLGLVEQDKNLAEAKRRAIALKFLPEEP